MILPLWYSTKGYTATRKFNQTLLFPASRIYQQHIICSTPDKKSGKESEGESVAERLVEIQGERVSES